MVYRCNACGQDYIPHFPICGVIHKCGLRSYLDHIMKSPETGPPSRWGVIMDKGPKFSNALVGSKLFVTEAEAVAWAKEALQASPAVKYSIFKEISIYDIVGPPVRRRDCV